MREQIILCFLVISLPYKYRKEVQSGMMFPIQALLRGHSIKCTFLMLRWPSFIPTTTLPLL